MFQNLNIFRTARDRHNSWSSRSAVCSPSL